MNGEVFLEELIHYQFLEDIFASTN